MPTNGKTPILDMKYNVDYDVEILDYKEGENNYGPWHFYQMKYDGDRYGHFAQSDLQEAALSIYIILHDLWLSSF